MPESADPENVEGPATPWPEIRAEEHRNKERAMAKAEAHIGRRFAEHRARLGKLTGKT